MTRFGFPKIDFLKFDIEGAKVELFSTAEQWIDRVGCWSSNCTTARDRGAQKPSIGIGAAQGFHHPLG